MKQCTKCKEIKSLDSFYPKKRKTKIGFTSNCKDCFNLYRFEYYKQNPDKKKLTNRKSQLVKYKLTIDQFDQLYLKQQGRCLGCDVHQSELNKRISVDHCHKTGQVRGLLCQPCNTILGLCKEDQIILSNLINYLNKNSISLMKAGI